MVDVDHYDPKTADQAYQRMIVEAQAADVEKQRRWEQAMLQVGGCAVWDASWWCMGDQQPPLFFFSQAAARQAAQQAREERKRKRLEEAAAAAEQAAAARYGAEVGGVAEPRPPSPTVIATRGCVVAHVYVGV